VAPAPAVNAAVTAPAPSRPAAASVAEPEVEEEFAWPGLANDTQEAAARGDTTPQQQDKPAARPPLAAGEQKAVAREKGVNRLVIGLMVGAAVLVVVVGGLVAAGYFVYTTFIVPEVAANVRPILVVSSRAPKGKAGVYSSVQAALRMAQKDDVIEIADETITENISLEFNPARSTEVTIQAAPGVNVVWRSARKDPSDPIIRLSGASFFKLKGERITFDGDLGDKEQVKDLILVMSDSPGLTLENAEFKNYGRSAILVINARGNLEKPMRFERLAALTPSADKEGSMFLIDAKENMRIGQVDYFEILDVRAAGLTVPQQYRAQLGAVGPNYHKLPDGW
jgi:hypothetical protein